jgi:signal transduction histidine kinase
MTSIRSFSEILLDEQKLTADERQRFVRTIHHESLRLTKLLDDILGMSALDRGERGWDNAPIEAEHSIDRAIEVCSALAQQRRMQLTIGTRVPSAMISGEPDRLCQVLINLISNAIKYNDAAEPMVEVRSRTGRGRYLIEVADNGPGIPKSERKLIFEKFARGRSGGVTAPAGAGLGLAISRQLIERMNGKLELLPGTGQGACFRISLPLL